MKRRTALILAGIVIAQALLFGVYVAVESQRGEASLSTEPPRAATGTVGSFTVMANDGTSRDLIDGGRPVLVHFWATWCAPCIDELPLVLALPDGGFDVVAVALDDDWSSVDEFVDGDHPRVVRADRARAEELFDISSLPQTVLIDRDGRMRLRVNGARDWTDDGFVRYWSTR